MTNREIDALVAEKVFAKEKCECGLHRGAKAWTAFSQGGLPCYSTDPAASKQLRDKMRAEGWRISLFWPYVDRSPRWHCCIQRTKDPLGDDSFHGDADTEEMAVALAALKALGQGGRQNAAAGNPE